MAQNVSYRLASAPEIPAAALSFDIYREEAGR